MQTPDHKCYFSHSCHLTFLPPYSPSPAEQEDPQLFVDNVRSVMAASARIPTCDISYAEIIAKYGNKKKKS